MLQKAPLHSTALDFHPETCLGSYGCGVEKPVRAEVWAGIETASPAPSWGHSNGEAVVLVPKEGLVLRRKKLCRGSSGSP